MAAVRAYMMSLLVVRRLTASETFAAKFPHHWLVWEPGQWKPSAGEGSATRLASNALPDRPLGGDALCFELVQPKELKVGRAADCDILINDATVSREHVLLVPGAGGGWSAKALSAGATSLDGAALGGHGLELKPGAKLRLGDVLLSHYDAEGMISRLDQQARLSRNP